MNVRLQRLQADYEEIKRGLLDHQAIRIRGVSGNPPDRYQIEYHVRSLQETAEGQITERTEHVAEIYLTLGYPRQAPQCRMLTPVFHPNVAPHAVCIGDHWAAGESLLNLIVRVAEILAYQSYNVKSPLNGAAARWVEENGALVPTDSRDFSPGVWSDTRAAARKPGECENCRSAGSLSRCSAGHNVCKDCLVSCSVCGATYCLVCRLAACAVCGGLVCGRCVATCPVCSRKVCKTHLQSCAACGAAACPDCTAACSVCGRTMCMAHVRQCTACRAVLCHEHSVVCGGCGRAVCEQHLRKCGLCGSAACPDCAFTCSECGVTVCTGHVGQCSVCKSVLCSGHVRTCVRCGRKVCGTHFVPASRLCASCAAQPAASVPPRPPPIPPPRPPIRPG